MDCYFHVYRVFGLYGGAAGFVGERTESDEAPIYNHSKTSLVPARTDVAQRVEYTHRLVKIQLNPEICKMGRFSFSETWDAAVFSVFTV